jgi:hypothetical protein
MSGRDGWTVMLAVAEFYRPRRPGPEEPEEERPPFVQYRDTSYIPKAPVKTSRRFLPGFLLSLIGLVVLLSSMSMPWYSYTISGKAWIGNVYYDVYDRADYTFTGIRVVDEKSVPGFTIGHTNSQGCAEYDKHFTDTRHASPRLSGVYSGTLLVLVAAATLCALGAFLSAVFRLRKKRLLFPVIVLLSGALLALAAAGAFSAWHQPAVENDRSELHVPTYPTSPPSGPYDSFSGESSRAPLDYEWGPAVGWYLAMAGPALLLLGAVVLYAMNRGENG